MADSTTSRVSLTLDSNLESVKETERMAESWARQAGFDEDTASNIAMSVREATVNAILHGNRYQPDLKVTCAFELTPQALVVRIGDQGKGLNPDEIPDPLAPENILRGSGRGVFLMKAFMDEVKFRSLDPGTEITLVKHRPAV